MGKITGEKALSKITLYCIIMCIIQLFVDMQRELLYVDKVRITARLSNQKKARITSDHNKAVKSGQRVLIKRAVVTDITGETQRILIGTTKPYNGASLDTTKTFEGPIRANTACETGLFLLEEGDVVGAEFEGMTERDEILLTVVGVYIDT